MIPTLQCKYHFDWGLTQCRIMTDHLFCSRYSRTGILGLIGNDDDEDPQKEASSDGVYLPSNQKNKAGAAMANQTNLEVPETVGIL